MVEQMSSAWISIRGAAQSVGCATVTMYDMVRRGDVRAMRTPLGLVVSRADAERIAQNPPRPGRPKGRPDAYGERAEP